MDLQSLLNILLYLIPFVFAILIGRFNAQMDCQRDIDYKINVLFKYYFSKGDDYINWFLGGNKKYPPGNPFKADFWHWSKHCCNFCITGMVMSAVLVTIKHPTPYLLTFLLLYAVSGFSFTFHYSYKFRTDRTFKDYLRHLFVVWKVQQ